LPFAGLDLGGLLDVLVAERGHDRLDRVVAHADRPATHGQLGQMPAVRIPSLLQHLAFGAGGLGQELELGKLILQLEADERLWQGRPKELAVGQVHGRGSGYGFRQRDADQFRRPRRLLTRALNIMPTLSTCFRSASAKGFWRYCNRWAMRICVSSSATEPLAIDRK